MRSPFSKWRMTFPATGALVTVAMTALLNSDRSHRSPIHLPKALRVCSDPPGTSPYAGISYTGFPEVPPGQAVATREGSAAGNFSGRLTFRGDRDAPLPVVPESHRR